MDIQAAVAQLNLQLPLKARQEQLPQALKKLHQAILRGFIEYGRAPTGTELETVLQGEALKAGLRKLGEADLIVLDTDQEAPAGAYPVTSEPTPHQVTVQAKTFHAMCALDALAVAPMFGQDIRITSTCHISNAPITVALRADSIIDAQPADLMIGIRWQTPTTIAAHSMCREMVFLKDRSIAESWQAREPDTISLFTLSEAFEVSKRFFLPLMR